MAMNIDLADSNTWDDSALTRSWNEALKEYKKYHSIHAQKKKLSEVLTKDELDLLAQNGIQLGSRPPAALFTTGEHDDGNETTEEYEETEGNIVMKPESDLASDVPAEVENNSSNQSNIPAALMASVKDESTRNLMMSWYWAGYYTGLQEGRAMNENPSKTGASLP